MKFRYNHMTFEVPPDVDIVVTVTRDMADFDFVKGNRVVSMYGPEGETWKGAGIHTVFPADRCISCGRAIEVGVEYCEGQLEPGVPCETDLRDSNNRVPEHGHHPCDQP